MTSTRDEKPAGLELELELDVPVRPVRAPKPRSEKAPEAPLEIALDYGSAGVSSSNMPTTVRTPQLAQPTGVESARNVDALEQASEVAAYGANPSGIFDSMKYVIHVHRRRGEVVKLLAASEARVTNLCFNREATLVAIGTRALEATAGMVNYADLHAQLSQLEQAAKSQYAHYQALERDHHAELRLVESNLVALETAYQEAAREEQAAELLARELRRECERLDAKQRRIAIEIRNAERSPSAPPPSADAHAIAAAVAQATATFDEANEAAKRAAARANGRKSQWQRALAERKNRESAFARSSAPVTQAMGQADKARTCALCELARRALSDRQIARPEWTVAATELEAQDHAVRAAETQRDVLKASLDSYDPTGFKRGLIAWGVVASAIALSWIALIAWRLW